MTSDELHALVKSVEDPDTVDSFSNGFYTLTPDELMTLCRKAQAQALRDVRDRMAVTNGTNPLHFLDRMADELERT